MNTPKVILLNGFAGSGKTTIARMYVDYHPLSIVIEGDELIVNIGDWLKNEDRARDLVFKLTKTMVATALKEGHDIILPYLVTNPEEAAEIEQIAHVHNANYYEFYLATEKVHAIERLLSRGTWGEAGLSPLSKEDIPRIEELYSHMESALQLRPKSVHIQIEEGNPADAYQKILANIT
jgi:predicted kinase